MKELDELTEVEKSVLIVSSIKLNHSLKCHQPKQVILKGIINMNPKIRNKAFKSLVSNGFLVIHPTGRSTTYELTQKGLVAVDKLIKDNFNNL